MEKEKKRGFWKKFLRGAHRTAEVGGTAAAAIFGGPELAHVVSGVLGAAEDAARTTWPELPPLPDGSDRQALALWLVWALAAVGFRMYWSRTPPEAIDKVKDNPELHLSARELAEVRAELESDEIDVSKLLQRMRLTRRKNR